MTADPTHCGGQTVPVRMSAFLRHISIMHLLSLGYEHYDDCLCGFKLSFIMALTSAGSRRKADSGALHPPVSACLAPSRAQIRAQTRFLTCPFPFVPYLKVLATAQAV